MNRRIWALLLSAVLVLGLLTGCGASAPGGPSLQEDSLRLVEDSAESLRLVEQTPAPEQEEAGPSLESEPPAAEAPETAAPLEDASEAEAPAEAERQTPAVQEDAEYTTPEDVALYIHTFGHLPGNFITKNDARDLGWDSSRGNLWDVAPGKSIGGDRFGNYEGLLPEGKYRECDVNYEGGYRGGERLIYGQDGSVYYTNDHYKSFTQLY